MSKPVLYGFWLSSCTWRVRAALHYKGIPYEEKQVDIVKSREQLSAEYRSISPSQKVPALVVDGVTLVESMAILQYLEDTYPKPSLLPSTPLLKARMREICETVVSGIQPLQNVGLASHFSTEQQYKDFTKYWTLRGLETLEDLLKTSSSSGQFCVGDHLTMADLCLVPQVYNALSRHNVDLAKFPTVAVLYDTLLKMPALRDTRPEIVRGKNKL
ncbi:probable maleylacetoacetate isomerase 1 isoform X2 [Aricia agestis]|nr:probable maleylacetoacetate isomerase 1 isoform X2 [Aricia agestis]